MRIEVLLSTMNQIDSSDSLRQLNIGNKPCTIINQVTKNIKPKTIQINSNQRFMSFVEKGLSKSRNRAILACNSDIGIISDNDIRYVDDYDKIVAKAYSDNPDADIIAFKVNGLNSSLHMDKQCRLGYNNALKLISTQITFKLDSIKRNNLKFDEKFGAGAKYDWGEEGIFLSDCLKAGLKICYVPVDIATVVSNTPSTWDKNNTENHFYKQGAIFSRISSKFWPILAARFAIRKRKLYNKDISFSRVIKSMFMGGKKYAEEREPIDFVVLWVDSNDMEWQKERKRYIVKNSEYLNNIDNSDARYRDMGTFKYWFRCVEKNADWVNKIHLVTCGHIPKWLNINHPKINIVKHSDFIDKKYLPTFNSNAIELNIHKITGLSENFVLFNDDVFLTKRTKKTEFFDRKGSPKNTCSFIPIDTSQPYCGTLVNNMTIINRHFNFSACIRKNIFKYLSLRQGKYILKTYPMLIYKSFSGFANFHIANSYKKSTLEKVWLNEEKEIETTVKNKFRDYKNDVSHWLFNYWQFAEGEFSQRCEWHGRNTDILDPRVPMYIKKRKYHTLCINDIQDADNIKQVERKIIESFKKAYPEKSSYEK